MAITRTFTIAELHALDLPPDEPNKPEYFPDHVLADEFVRTLKYTALRRVIFEDENGDTWAVEYEADLDMGDYEVGDGAPDNHGWFGDVTATAVEERQVLVTRWEPVESNEPEPGR
jgi:hypothetical protein